MNVDYTKERRIMDVIGADLPLSRKISKLELMALRAFPSSPVQRAIQEARDDLREANR